jgi:amidohydrolase
MAGSDWFTIKVHGKGSHGSQPWSGIDPVVVSAQIIEGLQTIVSRQTELTKDAAVISVCVINGGVRSNRPSARLRSSPYLVRNLRFARLSPKK